MGFRSGEQNKKKREQLLKYFRKNYPELKDSILG